MNCLILKILLHVTNECDVRIAMCICGGIVIVAFMTLFGFLFYTLISKKHAQKVEKLKLQKELISSNRQRLADYRKEILEILKKDEMQNEDYLKELRIYEKSLVNSLDNEANIQK